MSTIKTTCRMSADLSNDLDVIAAESKKSRNDLIIEAVKAYRDSYYMDNKATIIPEHILKAIEGMVSGLEQSINSRSNQLLSAIARELFVIQKILADEVEVNEADVTTYEHQAVEQLSRNNRIFRLSEFLK